MIAYFGNPVRSYFLSDSVEVENVELKFTKKTLRPRHSHAKMTLRPRPSHSFFSVERTKLCCSFLDTFFFLSISGQEHPSNNRQ